MLSESNIRALCPHPNLSLQVLEEVSSTNTLLREQAEAGAPEGTALIARRQTAGRGRRDRQFFSPGDSGLYLSLLLRPSLPAREALSLTAGAAVVTAQTLEAFGVPAQIKWVNDIFSRGKKVCGILTEGAADLKTGGFRYAIVGIGINLYPPAGGFPPDLSEAGAVFLQRPADETLPDRLAAELLSRLLSLSPTLAEKAFFEEYRRRSLVLGQPITILEGGQTRPALALELASDFSLRVREASGQIRTLTSGEVSIRPLSG